MNKKIILLVSLLLASQNASAAVITKNADGNIVISGSVGKEYANSEVQIQVLGSFDEKKNFEDAALENNSETPIYMDKTYANTAVVNDSGEYLFVYNVKEKNKYYAVAVAEPESEKVRSICLFVPDKALEESFINEINGAATAETLLEIMNKDEYKSMVYDNRAELGRVKEETAVKAIAAELKKDCPYENFSGFEDKLTILCAVWLTNEAESGDAARKIAEEKTDLTKAQLFGAYVKFSEKEKNGVFGRMTGRGISTFAEYITIFDESVFLNMVEQEKYASNMSAILNENAKKLNIDLTGYASTESEVNKKLYGKYFKTADEFKTALKQAIASAGGGTPTGGSGSGGNKKSDDTGKILMPGGNQTKTEENAQNNYFDDLGGVKWAEDAINKLAEKGVVSGKDKRIFSPSDNVSREEFVKMTIGAFGIKSEEETMNFDDVDKKAWYYESISAAFSCGIISGIDEKNFGVGKSITREDMAVILFRAAERNFGIKPEADGERFGDDADISDYAKTAVYTLKCKGVVSGSGDNRFEAKRTATRAEAAKMIYSLLSLFSAI